MDRNWTCRGVHDDREGEPLSIVRGTAPTNISIADHVQRLTFRAGITALLPRLLLHLHSLVNPTAVALHEPPLHPVSFVSPGYAASNVPGVDGARASVTGSECLLQRGSAAERALCNGLLHQKDDQFASSAEPSQMAAARMFRMPSVGIPPPLRQSSNRTRSRADVTSAMPRRIPFDHRRRWFGRARRLRRIATQGRTPR